MKRVEDNQPLTVDLEELQPDQVYHFLMSSIVPRPVAFVTTVNENGVVNAAPFSSFVALTPAPPTVGIVIGSWEGRLKDTLCNIRSSSEFTISLVTENEAQLVQRCSEPLPMGVSEIEDQRILTAPGLLIGAPRLLSAPVAMECRVVNVVPFGHAPDHLVAGRIVKTVVRSDCWNNGRLRENAWAPLARVGGGKFAQVSNLFNAPVAAREAAQDSSLS